VLETFCKLAKISSALQPGHPEFDQSLKMEAVPGAATMALTEELPPATRPMGKGILRFSSPA
jgi:hypothetical protein